MDDNLKNNDHGGDMVNDCSSCQGTCNEEKNFLLSGDDYSKEKANDNSFVSDTVEVQATCESIQCIGMTKDDRGKLLHMKNSLTYFFLRGYYRWQHYPLNHIITKLINL